LSPVNRTGIHLESPLRCLAFLAILAAAISLIAARMPELQLGPRPTHVSARDLLAGLIGMLMISAVALPAMRLAMGPGASRYPIPWPSRLRRGIFLALKVALIQPILFGGFLVVLPILSAPIANLGFAASWLLVFRWVLIDQQRRCPVCLRLLTEPIRIGSASHTFLEWYGAESTCSPGHGLLHISEIPASYSAKPGWLSLGDSWSGLFASSMARQADSRVRREP